MLWDIQDVKQSAGWWAGNQKHTIQKMVRLSRRSISTGKGIGWEKKFTKHVSKFSPLLVGEGRNGTNQGKHMSWKAGIWSNKV